ncbi:hypothetical protein NQ318_005147 [Aromia moschata]|uniref:Uncharacterized protein n=1 Tax=Aromia moschata TaxID=1265417 RepID=A0AAV8YAM4_9CUCU|nr:hypothetical protein NQ318_005147 [Aromia moschata]
MIDLESDLVDIEDQKKFEAEDLQIGIMDGITFDLMECTKVGRSESDHKGEQWVNLKFLVKLGKTLTEAYNVNRSVRELMLIPHTSFRMV